ncbi:MAG: HEAT repeat domain-containing protein [Acidobacteria bacterium]|nr:MAG: HEAT repeat domain-containing protein [Acidobacteriota bacterium]
MQLAWVSPKARDKVIELLMLALVTSMEDQAKFSKVERITQILGKLEAKRAVPVLAVNIGWHGLVSDLSLRPYPFAQALVAIGPPAVGAVGAVLRDATRPRERALAAVVLGRIGNSAAADALRSAQPRERDADVRRAIVASLREIGRAPHEGQ